MLSLFFVPRPKTSGMEITMNNSKQKKLYNETLGMYVPAFYFIQLNSDINFEENKFNDTRNELGTFYHEYVHYLQNVTTTFGYYTNTVFLQRLNGCIYKVTNSNNIKRPVNLSDIQNADLLYDVYNYMVGDNDDWTYDIYDDLKICDMYLEKNIDYAEYEYNCSEDIDQALLATYNTPKIKVKITKDKKSKIAILNFGASCIQESMARLIENSLYPARYLGYQVQYDICKMIIKTYIPSFGKKDSYIVAICDASLMYDNPGQIFYGIVFMIKRENFVPKTIEEVYDFVFSRYKPSYKKHFVEFFDSSLKGIDDLFPSNNNYYTEINRYFNNIYNKSRQLRENQMSFISKIADNSPELGKNMIKEIINDLEIPLLINNKNETFGGISLLDKPNSCNSLILPAIFSLLNILSTNLDPVCSLIEICEKQDLSLVNENCKKQPWKKVQYSMLCPFAQLWYIWGLDKANIS